MTALAAIGVASSILKFISSPKIFQDKWNFSADIRQHAYDILSNKLAMEFIKRDYETWWQEWKFCERLLLPEEWTKLMELDRSIADTAQRIEEMLTTLKPSPAQDRSHPDGTQTNPNSKRAGRTTLGSRVQSFWGKIPVFRSSQMEQTFKDWEKRLEKREKAMEDEDIPLLGRVLAKLGPMTQLADDIAVLKEDVETLEKLVKMQLRHADFVGSDHSPLSAAEVFRKFTFREDASHFLATGRGMRDGAIYRLRLMHPEKDGPRPELAHADPSSMKFLLLSPTPGSHPQRPERPLEVTLQRARHISDKLHDALEFVQEKGASRICRNVRLGSGANFSLTCTSPQLQSLLWTVNWRSLLKVCSEDASVRMGLRAQRAELALRIAYTNLILWDSDPIGSLCLCAYDWVEFSSTDAVVRNNCGDTRHYFRLNGGPCDTCFGDDGGGSSCGRRYTPATKPQHLAVVIGEVLLGTLSYSNPVTKTAEVFAQLLSEKNRAMLNACIKWDAAQTSQTGDASTSKSQSRLIGNKVQVDKFTQSIIKPLYDHWIEECTQSDKDGLYESTMLRLGNGTLKAAHPWLLQDFFTQHAHVS